MLASAATRPADRRLNDMNSKFYNGFRDLLDVL